MLPSISMDLVIAFGKEFLVYHLAAFGPGAVEWFSGDSITGKVDARLISTFKVHLGGVWDGGHFRRHLDSPITYFKVLIIGADKQFQKEVFSLR